jgi:hypothetical protein
MDVGVSIFLGLAGLFLAFIVFWIVGRMRAWKTRKQKLAEWARRNGMQFAEATIEAAPLAPLPTLKPGGNVTSCEASNVARGTRAEMPVVVFDLARGTRSKSGTHTTYRTQQETFALFERPDRSLPYFDFAALSSASPSSFQGKALGFVTSLAAALGGAKAGKVLTLEGRPGFLLSGHDEEAVRAVFTPSLLEHFDQNPGWTVEAQGSHILVGLKPGLRPGWTRPQIEGLVAYQDFDKFLPLAAAIALRL